ncbi:MAG: hypothetical protein IJU96_08600 [Clostridia bacterium]|nr:hypothetical protein [Clostridia bacterium]
MKKAAEKHRRLAPFLVFFLLVFAFHLFFVRLMPKTDDGNFLAIVSDPSFTYAGWLRARYLTVSGRTVGEFLLAFFLKRPLIFWKLLNSLAITYLGWFWVRISLLIGGKSGAASLPIFCCCGLFTAAVSCLNPSAFWFSGSFSYLLPFAGLLAVIEPLIGFYFTGRVSLGRLLLSLPCVLLATMQEQSALCCAALSVLLIAAVIVKQKRANAFALLLLAPIGLCVFHLFSAPGVRGRMAMESASFEAYHSYRLIEKLFCGVSAFFANAYFLGAFLPLLFTVLLLLKLRQTEPKKALKKFCFLCGLFEIIGFLLILLSAVCSKTLPHILVRTAFQTGQFSSAFWLLFAGGCLITAAIFALTVILIVREKKIGLSIGVCAAAAFFSALVMGFSPTVFASGQRVFFYTNMFLFTACAFLFSSLDEGRQKTAAFRATVLYACGTFCLDCVAFKLFEHPLMG